MGRTGAALLGGARLLASLVSKSLCIGIGDQPDSGEGKAKAHFRRSYTVCKRMEILTRSPNISRPNKRRSIQ